MNLSQDLRNTHHVDPATTCRPIHDSHGWTGNAPATLLAPAADPGRRTPLLLSTGAMSGIDALSVGVVRGHNGLELLAELEARHGEIRAPIIRTPDLRLCYLFQHRPGLATEASVLPGIDVYADDGVLTLPPSASATGEYSWFKGRSPEDMPPPPWPAWLLDLLNQVSATEGGRSRGADWSLEAARALYRRLAPTGLLHVGRNREVSS